MMFRHTPIRDAPGLSLCLLHVSRWALLSTTAFSVPAKTSQQMLSMCSRAAYESGVCEQAGVPDVHMPLQSVWPLTDLGNLQCFSMTTNPLA